MIIAIDVETTGLNPWRDRLLGVSITEENLRSTYYPYAGPDAVAPFPREILADPAVIKVGHNIRFDIKWLEVNYIPVRGPIEDTKLMAQLLDENRPLGLKPLSEKYLGLAEVQCSKELKKHLDNLHLKMGDLGDPRVDKQLVSRYCCEDTKNTMLLYRKLRKELEAQPRVMAYYREEFLPMESLLLEMELRGNRIDMTRIVEAELELNCLLNKNVRELCGLISSEIRVVEDEIWEKEKRKYKTERGRAHCPRPTFNWNSGEHKRRLFYRQLGLGKYCSETTESGQPTLSRKILRSLTIPEPKLRQALDLQIDHQTYSKMLSSYVYGLWDRMEGETIHGEYYQASQEDFKKFSDDAGGTVTGRLSHRNPNLGNLPRKTTDYWKGTFVKDLFIPSSGGRFLYADYSQIELRVAAHLAQDEAFITAFNSGQDPHQQTADRLNSAGLNIKRQQAKTINFLLIYYGSARRLCQELGLNEEKDLPFCEKIREEFFKSHPQLLQWIQRTMGTVKKFGWVESMFGRVRRLPDVWSYDKFTVSHALKQAGNFVVQSVAASITKRAMLRLKDAGFTIVNQVHDSITCEVPPWDAECMLKQMLEIMGNVVQLSVPIVADGKIIDTFKE